MDKDKERTAMRLSCFVYCYDKIKKVIMRIRYIPIRGESRRAEIDRVRNTGL